jgi:hypothetical protein
MEFEGEDRRSDYRRRDELSFRVGEMWRAREGWDQWRREVDADRQALQYMREDLHDLAVAFNGLRKTLLGFAFSIAGAAVVFALTVLTATGKL